MNACLLLCLISIPITIIFFARGLRLEVFPKKQDDLLFILPNYNSVQSILMVTALAIVVHLPLYGIWRIAERPYDEVVAKAAMDAEKNSDIAKRFYDSSNIIALFAAIPVSIGAFVDSCSPAFWYIAHGVCWLYIFYSFVIILGMAVISVVEIKKILCLRKFQLIESASK
jgi:hypothetical protein